MGLASFNAMRKRQEEMKQSTNAVAESKNSASADIFDSMKKSELIEYLESHNIQYSKYQTASELRDLAKYGG